MCILGLAHRCVFRACSFRGECKCLRSTSSVEELKREDLKTESEGVERVEKVTSSASLLFLSSIFRFLHSTSMKMNAVPGLRSPRLTGGATAHGAAAPAVAMPVAASGARATAAAAARHSSSAMMAMSSSSSPSSSPSRARVLLSRRASVAAAASSMTTGAPAAAVSQADGQVRVLILVVRESLRESERRALAALAAATAAVFIHHLTRLAFRLSSPPRSDPRKPILPYSWHQCLSGEALDLSKETSRQTPAPESKSFVLIDGFSTSSFRPRRDALSFPLLLLSVTRH